MSAITMDADALGARAEAMIATLAPISSEPDRLVRLFLSPEHRRAADQVGEWMRAAGMQVSEDALGTVRGRTGEGRRLLIGSHLDSVIDGGNYDGPLGVIAGILTVGNPCEQRDAHHEQQKGEQEDFQKIVKLSYTNRPVKRSNEVTGCEKYWRGSKKASPRHCMIPTNRATPPSASAANPRCNRSSAENMRKSSSRTMPAQTINSGAKAMRSRPRMDCIWLRRSTVIEVPFFSSFPISVWEPVGHVRRT